MRGFATYPPHPFLVLIQEKGAKENQAPTGGGEAGRIRNGAIEMVSDGGGLVPGAIVGRQGRGELHSPQHVPIRDRSAWRLVAYKIKTDRGTWRSGAYKLVSILGAQPTVAYKIKTDRGE